MFLVEWVFTERHRTVTLFQEATAVGFRPFTIKDFRKGFLINKYFEEFEESESNFTGVDFDMRLGVVLALGLTLISSTSEVKSKSSRAILELILEAFLTGEGLKICGCKEKHSD